MEHPVTDSGGPEKKEGIKRRQMTGGRKKANDGREEEGKVRFLFRKEVELKLVLD